MPPERWSVKFHLSSVCEPLGQGYPMPQYLGIELLLAVDG